MHRCRRKTRHGLIAYLWASIAVFALPLETTAEQPAAVTTLVMGYVTENPRKQSKRMKPIADLVASKLSGVGITGAKLKLVRSQEEMIQMLAAGNIHWVSETPLGASRYMSEAGATPLLIRKKSGVRGYHSLIFVRQDSAISSLADLRGKTIVFEDPGSTSAHFIPRFALVNAGLDLQPLQSYRQQPDAGKLGYLFSGAEQNSAAWVYEHIVDAAAISNLDWNKQEHISEYQKSGFRIIYSSSKYPRSIELTSSRLPAVVTAALKKALLSLEGDAAAAEALQSYHGTTGFEALSTTDIEMLEQVNVQYNQMQP